MFRLKSVENLKSNLKTHALEICGEEDRLRGDRILIAPLQISTQARDMNELDQIVQMGHFHRRKDVINIYVKNPSGTISYEKIFQTAYERALQSSRNCLNDVAKTKHIQSRANLVFISGQAGIGKTTLSKLLVQKMLDANVRLYNAEFVFFVKFRDLNYNVQTDLLQFLTASASFTSVLKANDRKHIIKNLEKNNNVIIVMDGYDETSIDLKLRLPNCDALATTKAASFTYNLLFGNILPNAKKIVTSRPRQLLRLPDEFSSYLFLNLHGLDKSGQKQICRDLCRDDPARQNRILSNLESRPDLKSLCYVPINCIMVMMSFFALNSYHKCSVVTLTLILVNVLQEWFLKKLKGEFQTKEISILAFKGFQSNSFSFHECEIKEANINFENTTAFLTNNIKFQLFQNKAVTYFCHLMWQEFFVAVKLRFYTDAKTFRSILESKDLERDKYEVVTKFLFGLCNQHTEKEFLDCIEIENINNDSDRHDCKNMLKNFAIEKLEGYFNSPKKTNDVSYFRSILPSLEWVRELGEETFTQRAAAYLKEKFLIKTDKIFPNEISIINHILRSRKNGLAVTIDDLSFVENCSQYFFNEFHITLLQNPVIEVSSKT